MLQNQPQHVPVQEYKDNLTAMIDLVRTPDSPYHIPDVGVILIGPPPAIPERWHEWLSATIREAGGVPGSIDRDRQYASIYAAACKEVADSKHIPFIDLYEEIAAEAGGLTDECLGPFF